MTTPLRIHEFTGSGIELKVAEIGIGGRPLLLVHGFAGEYRDFDPWFQRLASAGWHVIAPDLRGHGDSAKPEGPDNYTVELYLTDIKALVRDVGWSDFVALGHSMGAMILQQLVITDPLSVDALILVDTHHGSLEIDAKYVNLIEAVLAKNGTEGLLKLAEKTGFASSSRRGDELLKEDPQYATFMKKKFIQTAAGAFVGTARELGSCESRLEALSQVDIPCLVIAGEQDFQFLGPSLEIATAMPNARSAVIPNCGHNPQFEAPEPTWAVLYGFLSELEPPT